MDSGLNGTSADWETLLPDLRRITRVCVYDRAGLGASDLSPHPRTSGQMVEELRALLANAGVPGPYVLVGWSFGGMNVRLYAARYPDEVAGVVLLDSSHPDRNTRSLALLPPRARGEPASLTELRHWWATDWGIPRWNPLGVDWQTSAEEVRAAGTLGDIPLAVVTRSPDPAYGDWDPDFPEDVALELDRAWQEMQRELVALSTNGRQIIAEQSGHCIHCSQPRLVIHAIREVVEEARGPLSIRTGDEK
jgi:pimeloyl-ACP methyl ester carboxylesterase